HEHRHDRRWQARRGAGHGRARHLRQEAARHARRPGDGGNRAAHRRAKAGPGRRARVKRLCFASGNKHKVAEIAAMLRPRGWEVEPLVLTVEEDAPTFAGNAEKKARAALAQSGLPSLADDSGLEVDALDGAPGVLSARWAGAHDDAANNAKLLAAMADVPDGKRTARFRCALALVDV